MAKEQVLVPDIGGAEAAEVVELLVGPGDRIEVEQGLIVLESDKASMEIPSTVAGTLVELLVKEGDQLAEGDPIAWVESDSAGDSDAGAGEDGGDQGGEGAEDGGGAAPGEAEAPGSGEAEESDPGSGSPAPDAAAAPGGEGGETVVDVPVPDIGTPDPVDLVEVAVAVGDRVEEGDSLVVLESDKASMEVPAPRAGTVQSLEVAEGDTVRTGDVVARLRVPDDGGGAGSRDRDGQPTGDDRGRTRTEPRDDGPPTAGGDGTGAASSDERTGPREPGGGEDAGAGDDAGAGSGGARVYAGPAVRKMARELGVELARVRGSGHRGRIVKEDVQEHVRDRLSGRGGDPVPAGGGIPPLPEVDHEKYGPVEYEDLSRPLRRGAANLHRAWLNVPHVTNHDEADVTDLEAFRADLRAEADRAGVKVTPVSFLLRACAHVLQAHPRINASLDLEHDRLVLKKHYHLGLAVDTPSGLLVPVIRDADRLGLFELSEAVQDLSERARQGKLRPDEMRGGTFTISSLGALGGTGFTPILNPPELAILGVGRMDRKPVWRGDAFEPRKVLPLSLSYDHRAVNGADAGRFLGDLRAVLEDVRRLVL